MNNEYWVKLTKRMNFQKYTKYTKYYNKLLNIVLSEKFEWFKKIELNDIQVGNIYESKNLIPIGKIYVDSIWGYNQWKEYHYDSSFPTDEEVSFGDIIGGDLSKEIQEQFKLCFSQVIGSLKPKYMCFSWLEMVLVDEDDNTLQESIRRILREKLTARVRRRIPYDEMENEFFESFDSAYNLTKRKKLFLDELIYTTITMMMDGIHWRFVSTLPEDEFWYDDIHKELENHYRDRITQMYNERRGIKESILRENDYSPAGKEVTPNKIVVHKSNPMFRDKILQDGLKVKAGECYKIYVGDGTKCKPAIFATNSTNKRAWFDSTYDDDIWEINTEMIPNVGWFKDKHYDSKSKHIVTFQDIPREAITLKYKGSGSGDVKKWDKDSPNLYESIRRILKETLESEWNKGNYDYQHGYCHYFAYNIIDKIKKKFPKKDIKYYLLLASEVDKETQEPIQEYLIHVYIKIDDLLLDSNGFTTQSEAWQRAQEWEQRQSHLVPEEYETEVWEEESDEIPEYFFNNSFCNTKRVKQDLKDFLSHPSVQKLLVEK